MRYLYKFNCLVYKMEADHYISLTAKYKRSKQITPLLTLIAEWPNRPGGPPRLLILDQEWDTMKEEKLRASLQNP